jgi:aminomethyltransferase
LSRCPGRGTRGLVSAELLKRTSLYEKHQNLGARLVPFAGWEMPIQYKGISVEHQAVRERAGLFDVSHMGELELTGERALELVNSLITNDIARAANGQATYTCCCNERGTILDDLIVYRRAENDVLVVCNASNRDKISKHFAAAARGVCEFRDLSDETALLALQGPKALGILARAGVTLDLSTLKSFRFAHGTVAGVACTIARTGYTGEDGVELFCAWQDAPALWDTLLEAGAADGIEAIGLGARDTLRLDARLSLYGNDIDETTNPLEAGLGWVVKLDRPDFVGKKALLDIKERGLSRTLIGFVMTGRGIARHGYPLLDSAGEARGVCTSGGPSPTLGKSIGLGYFPIAESAIGTQFLVDCRGKQITAEIVKTPFYKRKSR